MPEVGTVCEVESRLFGPKPSILAEEFSGLDRIIMRAWRQLGESMPVVPLFGIPFRLFSPRWA